MYLCRLSVTKDSLAPRSTLAHVLSSMQANVSQDTRIEIPRARSKSDAVRMAASYALQAWRKFEHNGRECRAISASPKGQDKRGLNIQVNVQVRDTNKVTYSTPVARITAKQATDTPEVILEEGSNEFDALARVLDVDILIAQGQAYLYDNDIRRLIGDMLEQQGSWALWPGVYLLLSADAVNYAHTLEHTLGPCLESGSLSLSLIALDMSQANREALAREIGTELSVQLDKLTERCAYTSPHTPAIQKDYEALIARMAQAEQLLGVEVPCLESLIETEQAMMALA